MQALGFTHAEMQGTCKTLAAILNLGNLVVSCIKSSGKFSDLGAHKCNSRLCTVRAERGWRRDIPRQHQSAGYDDVTDGPGAGGSD